MNGLQNPFVVLAVIAWLNSPSHSLGEAAEKEAFRRHMMPRSQASLTNIGQPAEIPATFDAVPPISAAGTDSKPAGTKADAKDPQGGEKHDEAWWRRRIDTARKAVERDQRAADAVQTRVNALQRDVVNVDSPAQQAAVRKELLKALAELDNAKKMVEDGREAIRAIQEEARRLDVPAGWIR